MPLTEEEKQRRREDRKYKKDKEEHEAQQLATKIYKMEVHTGELNRQLIVQFSKPHVPRHRVF